MNSTYTLPADWRAVHILDSPSIEAFIGEDTTPTREVLTEAEYARLVALWETTMLHVRRDREYSAELRVVAKSLRRRTREEREWPG